MANLHQELQIILKTAKKCKEKANGVSEGIIQRIEDFETSIDFVLKGLLHCQQNGLSTQWIQALPLKLTHLRQWLEKTEAEALIFKEFADEFIKADIKVGKSLSSLHGDGSKAVLLFLYAPIESKDLCIDSLKNFVKALQHQTTPLPPPDFSTLSQANEQWRREIVEVQRLFITYSQSSYSQELRCKDMKFLACEVPPEEIKGRRWKILLWEEGDSREFVPPSEPSAVQVQKSPNEATIKVDWISPSIGESAITHFRIWYRASKEKPEKWMWVDAASSPASITGLPVGKTYLFKVSFLISFDYSHTVFSHCSKLLFEID